MKYIAFLSTLKEHTLLHNKWLLNEETYET